MRHARQGTDATMHRTALRGTLGLAGLFCAVWGLALQVSLPLATQLAPSFGSASYDLITAVTGRIYSGHGTADGDHSLPVQPDLKAILIKSDPPALHSADIPIPVPKRAAAEARWPAGSSVTLGAPRIDYARLARAPPSSRLV